MNEQSGPVTRRVLSLSSTAHGYSVPSRQWNMEVVIWESFAGMISVGLQQDLSAVVVEINILQGPCTCTVPLSAANNYALHSA